VAAVDAALALDPAARPTAAGLAAELRNALRAPQARPARKERPTKEDDTAVAPARRHARQVVPVALTVIATLVGATLLPFWPPGLVAAIVVVAGIAAWLDPRAGLAVALAAPVFPIGNVATSAAVLYAALAIGWLLLTWRDARHGLLFVSGPLLAAVGLLPLVPLVVQRASGWVRRAAHGAIAVLSAALLAGLAGDDLPVAGEDPGTLGIGPLTPVSDAASSSWSWLLEHPPVAIGAVLVGAASALLPWARGASRYGVVAVGFVLVASAVLAGAGVVSTFVCLAGWAIAGISAAVLRRVQ
jgi:hypothetical protein